MASIPYQKLIDNIVGSHLSRFNSNTSLDDIKGDCWLALLNRGPAESLPDAEAIAIIQEAKTAHLKVSRRHAKHEVCLNEALTVVAEPLEAEAQAQENVLFDFKSELLRNIISKLPADQRRVMETRYGFDYSLNQPAVKPLSWPKTAAIMGLSEQNCRTLNKHAQNTIKKELARHAK